MPCNGQMKFFTKSVIDLDQIGISITTSTNLVRADYVRDKTFYRYWLSDGSNDSTTETLTANFENQDIDRLHLLDNNFKSFTIKYWDGISAYVDFSNVNSLDAEGLTQIDETNNTHNTNYYEFDSVKTTSIQILVDTTQGPNNEKRLNELIISNELITLGGYPVFTPRFNRKQIKKSTIRGNPKFSNYDETFTCSLGFTRYPVADDIKFFKDLWDNEKEFLLWPCGGSEDQFRFNEKGSRLKDIFLCSYTSNYQKWFEANIYVLGVNGNLSFTEVN